MIKMTQVVALEHEGLLIKSTSLVITLSQNMSENNDLR